MSVGLLNGRTITFHPDDPAFTDFHAGGIRAGISPHPACGPGANMISLTQKTAAGSFSVSKERKQEEKRSGKQAGWRSGGTEIVLGGPFRELFQTEYRGIE